MLLVFPGGEIAVVGVAAEDPGFTVVRNHYEALRHAASICEPARARKSVVGALDSSCYQPAAFKWRTAEGQLMGT